jgi:predicted secreted protein
MAELQGKDVTLQISEDGGTTWKTLICLDTLTVDLTMDLNERPTRCGIKVGVSPTKGTMTGTSVSDDAPGGTEVSHQKLLDLITAGTKFDVKAVHTTPAKFYAAAKAYLTSLSAQAPSDDLLDFNWTMNMTGVIDVTS